MDEGESNDEDTVPLLGSSVVCTTVCLLAQPSATSAFDKLKALSGDWEGTVAWTGKESTKINAHYQVTGSESAVVEDLSNGMTSAYHLDGGDLRMTHFCAAQNQPRLRATAFGPDNSSIRFSFVDVTNLRSPVAGHVERFEIRFLAVNHIRVPVPLPC
jgi:hypothetical protein